MKKILLLLTALFIISSCSLDEDTQPDYLIEFLPADAVIIPTAVRAGRTYHVKVLYTKPNGCYLFDQFYTEREGDAILIAVQAAVRVDSECKKYENTQQEDQTFTFTCDFNYAADSYIFKFYTGLDIKGNKTYQQVEIPVIK
jgi:hypothetical protein